MRLMMMTIELWEREFGARVHQSVSDEMNDETVAAVAVAVDLA